MRVLFDFSKYMSQRILYRNKRGGADFRKSRGLSKLIEDGVDMKVRNVMRRLIALFVFKNHTFSF
ncbi:Uncharacterised protein [Chlamydia trachomatis]|nr:Uncharacterised protein [Chlamydia trachomatis]